MNNNSRESQEYRLFMFSYFVRMISVVSIMFFNCFCAFGQQQESNEIKLKLTEISDFKKIRATVFLLGPVKIWGSDTTVDSILWSMPLEKNTNGLSNRNNTPSTAIPEKRNGKPCTKLPDGLFVLQENLGDSVRILLSKRYNPFLEKEIKLVYPTDSLMTWTVDNVPEGVIPKTSVHFPFCINNQMVYEQVDLYLIPLKNPVVTWDDARLNSIPTLSIELVTNKTTRFSGAEIYVIQLKYVQPGPPLSIEIKENGAFHRDRVAQGVRYKRSYQLHDTVHIGREPYRLDSVDKGIENLYLHPVMDTGLVAHMPATYMSKLLPYFSEQKDYLVLDFWGTWCAPCIAALPHLQELYQSAKDKYNFLSICYDQPQNFDKAKEIFSEHGVKWPQILDSIQAGKPTMTRSLKVSTFPTYMVINKNGDILYSNFGTDGFDGLKKFMLKR